MAKINLFRFIYIIKSYPENTIILKLFFFITILLSSLNLNLYSLSQNDWITDIPSVLGNSIKSNLETDYKNIVITTIIIIIFLLTLIIALLVSIVIRRKTEVILRSLAEGVPDGLLVHALNGKILHCNKIFYQRYGYSYIEILKLNIKDIETPNSAKQYNDRLKKQIKDRVFSYQITYRSKEGKIIPVECNTTLINYHGKPAVLSIVRDITDRKKSEREKELLLKELANKNEELESLLYAASHDLRSPLVNIHGFSHELLLSCKEIDKLTNKTKVNKNDYERIKTLVKYDIPEALTYIINSSEKMNKLLKGLNKLSKLEHSSIELEEIDMNKVIKNIIENMHYRIKQVRAVISIKKLSNCIGDLNQITQAFTNIIDNSIKFVKPNQKAIIHISSEIDEEKQEVIYCIKDTGIGINPSQHKKIFELFYKLNPGKEIYGEGLGLSISKRIIEHHNGKIWIKSGEDKGTSIFISLPIN